MALVTAITVGFSPWVFGNAPWLSPAPVHFVAVPLAALSLAGLGFRSHAVQAILVALALLIAAASFALAPPDAPSAQTGAASGSLTRAGPGRDRLPGATQAPQSGRAGARK